MRQTRGKEGNRAAGFPTVSRLEYVRTLCVEMTHRQAAAKLTPKHLLPHQAKKKEGRPRATTCGLLPQVQRESSQTFKIEPKQDSLSLRQPFLSLTPRPGPPPPVQTNTRDTADTTRHKKKSVENTSLIVFCNAFRMYEHNTHATHHHRISVFKLHRQAYAQRPR